MSVPARAWSAALALALLGPAARAQDFTPAAPAGPAPGPAVLLERSLAGRPDALALEALAVRWLGAGELTTRAVAFGAAGDRWQAAAGWSQTGDPELGWNALAVALAARDRGAGVGLRALARRDRAGDGAGGEAAVTLEAGVGAAVALSPAFELWTSAPQLWADRRPPLARRLEIGVALAGDGGRAWLARRLAPSGSGEHEAGLALDLGLARAWAAAMDRPVRARLGLAGRAGPLSVAGEVEAHPALGETVRLGVSLHRGAP